MFKREYIILIIVIAILYYFIFVKKSKYYKFFRSIGFGTVLLDKFTNQELKDSYNYITNYTRKGIVLTRNIYPEFYDRIKAINDKFHIFSSI